jgi:hypothetical protein
LIPASHFRETPFMKRFLLRAAHGLAANAASIIATAALAAIGAGFWMAWPPLGLIIPGSIVFGCLALTRLRG